MELTKRKEGNSSANSNSSNNNNNKFKLCRPRQTGERNSSSNDRTEIKINNVIITKQNCGEQERENDRGTGDFNGIENADFVNTSNGVHG